MPRIWNSQVQSQGYLQNIPDNSLQQIGQTLQALGEKKRQDNMAIDLAEFQKEQISVMEQIQNTGSHDTAGKVDMIGGEVVSEGIPKTYMRQFSEKASKLKKMYPEAEDTLSQYEVSQFGKITNLYSSMKVTADHEYFQDHVNYIANEVGKGKLNRGEAYGSCMMVLNTLYMPPEMREAAQQSMVDYISMSEFDHTLRTSPMNALDSLDRNIYQDASAQPIQRMNDQFDRKLNSDVMAEIQKANQATGDTFGHNPNSDLIKMAQKRNMPELSAALNSAYAMNHKINALTSGDLQASKAQAANEYLLAHQTENSAMKQDAEMKMKFIQQREALVYANPDLVALQEGLEVPDYDPSNPTELVAARRDIRKAVGDRQNSKVSLFGKDTDALVQGIKQLPNDQRPTLLTSITSLLTGPERKDAIRELGSVDPLVGVAISVTPQNALPSREDTLLMGDILGDAPVEFKPKDSECLPDVSAYFSGVNVGDPAVIEHYKKAAVNVYARQAQRNGWDTYSSKDMNKILEQIAGPTIEFGDNKTAGFKTKTGQWADPDLASSALENALELGVVKATTPEGEDIAGSQILDYGSLVPSGENGVYYVRRSDGKYFNDESGQNPLLVNMNDIYTTDKSSRMGGFDAWKLSR